jgi:hypothetical protein
MGHFIHEALTHRTSPVCAGHVRLYPGFINENQTLWVDFVLMLLPQPAPAGNVRPILFAGVRSFF